MVQRTAYLLQRFLFMTTPIMGHGLPHAVRAGLINERGITKARGVRATLGGRVTTVDSKTGERSMTPQDTRPQQTLH